MSKPTQWADRPFELLPIPGTPGAPSCSNAGVMAIAIDMANVHNTFLRGLNSIYLQIPYINLPTDISDLLLYIKAWADSVHHHHSLEESFIFPRWGTLLKEAGITEDVMSANVAQHDEFEPKMLACLEWCEDVRAGNKEYDREELVSRIDGFAKVLMQHLHDEIETLMKLDPCDGKAVKKIFDDGANEGLKTADTVSYFISPSLRSTSLITPSLFRVYV